MKDVDSTPIANHASQTFDRLRGELLRERGESDHWTGFLSPSALSTATAISAIAAVLNDQPDHDDAGSLRSMIRRGLDYLGEQQNVDGGFGDTDRSHSNIATSYLVQAAMSLGEPHLADHVALSDEHRNRLMAYLRRGGELDGLRQRYGKDKTFVVPILTNLAIAGLVDWSHVPPLPFEAAVFPQGFYRFLRMPVVSYAIPALVAMGQARYLLGPKANPVSSAIRRMSVRRTLSVLGRMQPDSGGYLEATPLTSFVLMSLAATGRGDHEVAVNSLRFLRDSVLDDGCWPIDTNLATWLTSLSVIALSSSPGDEGKWCSEALADWHLGCQHRQRHPFTGADPGGWAWTDLSGGVPDADDTPAAILALHRMTPYLDRQRKGQIDEATQRGTDWLLRLQNRDGGWPTFCRGWGRLPFDRSSTDLTAHALRAIHVTADPWESSIQETRAIRRGESFLRNQQQADGSWLPLWFGNQDRDDEANPVYGTSRVLLWTATSTTMVESTRRGIDYLLSAQNGDGGWGGGPSVRSDRQRRGLPAEKILSTIEETAVAVEALSAVFAAARTNSEIRDGIVAHGGKKRLRRSIISGVKWLATRIDEGEHHRAWPIGFYFAKLWYHERLYPFVFTVAALGAFLNIADEMTDTPT